MMTTKSSDIVYGVTLRRHPIDCTGGKLREIDVSRGNNNDVFKDFHRIYTVSTERK